jgi:hypothetical protein
MVTGVAAGVTTIKATVAVANLSASTAVNVTTQSFGAGSLKGLYAFFLTSVDNRGQAVVVGSLTADGNGNITAGIADFNNKSGPTGPVNLTACNGCYNVWPDGRGEATISYGGQSVHVAFILSDVVSGVANKGKMIAFDGNQAFGNFELQTAGANLKGAYVFAFNGLDAASQSEAQIGMFDTVTNTGAFDVDDAGAVDGGSGGPLTFSSVTVTSFKGNRGTLALVGSTSLGTANYVFYTVDNKKAYFIEMDPLGSTALAGVAELQTQIQPLSPENPPSPCVKGTGNEATCNYAFLLTHAANSQNGVFEKAGQFNFCICNGGAIDHDIEDDDMDGQTWTITSGTRPFDSFGRSSMTFKVSHGTTNSTRSAIAYVVRRTATLDYTTSSARIYLMNTDASDSFPGVGAMDFIDAVANAAPVAGPYAFSLTAVGDANLLQLGQIVFDGLSNATGITYINNSGTLSAVAVGGVLAMNSGDTADGRGILTPFNGTTSSLTTYSVGTQGLILLGTGPDVSGRMEVQ